MNTEWKAVKFDSKYFIQKLPRGRNKMKRDNDNFAKLAYLIFCIVCILFLICAKPSFGATCTPGEVQTHIAKQWPPLFYKMASAKKERFQWTDWECEKLEAEVKAIVTKRVNKACGVTK